MTRDILEMPVGPDDHYLGPANAPVVLIEYGDFECPHCGRAFTAVREVLEALGDEVRFIFRNFPLIEVHPHAQAAAEAAESVAAHGGNDAYWDMHDILFTNQDALGTDDLLSYAEAVGVDPLAVASDLSTGAMAARVRGDLEGGLRSGVNGTPAFFVNGRRLVGDWSDPESFAAALRAASRTVAR
jgi:protein-disulfide isomerase